MFLKRPAVKIALIVLIATFTLSLHYMIFPYPDWLHLLHRRLCYIPILLGALWFGLRGGVSVSVAISLATLPIILRTAGPPWGNRDLVEAVFYIIIGLMTGFLVERRDREQARSERLGQKLEESEHMAFLGQMASGVAHEIRTPLGSIQGVAEIIGEDYPPEHVRRPFYDILMQEVDRLQGVVHDFLDLGRPVTVEPAETELEALVDDCFRSMEKPAAERGVRFEPEVEAGCRVFADPARLYQVLTNLVRNAVQFSPDGSSVRLRASSQTGGVLFELEDSGPGLPAGEEDRIFEPFFTSRRNGSGLGLAIADRVVQAHGGWIRAENREHGGARFTLWLPFSGKTSADCGEKDNGGTDR